MSSWFKVAHFMIFGWMKLIDVDYILYMMQYKLEVILIVISSDLEMILSNILIITFRMPFSTWTTTKGPSVTLKKTVVTLVNPCAQDNKRRDW